MNFERDRAREIIKEKIAQTRHLTMDDFAELAQHEIIAHTAYQQYMRGKTNKEDMLIRLVFFLIDEERGRRNKELETMMKSVAPHLLNEYEVMKGIQNECGDPNQATALNVFKEEK
jgi:hypothetical protein